MRGSARAPYNFVAPWSHPAASNGPTLNLPFARSRSGKKKKKKKREEEQADCNGTTLSFADFAIVHSRFIPLKACTILFFSLHTRDDLIRNEIDSIIDHGYA